MINDSQLSINTIRMLGIDAINRANSGHPGMVLGAAPIIYTLYTRHLNATPKQPNWINRDRFVLAAGHASMLAYSTLHLSGFKVSLEDIKSFRSLHSMTPGHPELGLTEGIDVTSGPLGQGIAHAVGIAMAEAFLGAKFNQPNFPLMDHYTYALCGDGDLHEGVTQEAISLAGHLKLKKLIVLYDYNQVILDGPLHTSFTEDVPARFQSVGWNVISVKDGTSVEQIDQAIESAKNADRPTLIIIPTVIGFGSKNQGTSKVHGAPLGEPDTSDLKKKLNWNYPPFSVDPLVYKDFQTTFGVRGNKSYLAWKKLMKAYRHTYPVLFDQWEKAQQRPNDNAINWPHFELGTKEATRVTSGKVINSIASQIPTFLGGAADVAKSIGTTINDSKIFGVDGYDQRNISFGIREFAMSCAQSGMLVHGGVQPFVGNFLVFADYSKPSIRTASLMKLPSIYVFTHDSIAVGEDGPTHQPIEQLAMLRTIPGVITFRPGNAEETVHAWRYAVTNKEGPTLLVLSRQDLVLERAIDYTAYKKGAYIASKESLPLKWIIITTGSELQLSIAAQTILEKQGIGIRVVSMTSPQLFLKQSLRYQRSILGGRKSKIVAVEMSNDPMWYRFAQHLIGQTTFGESGNAKDVLNHFGFTPEKLVHKILSL